MCGITGCLGPPEHADPLSATVRAMTRTLRHRGPDDEAVFVDPSRGVALGHRRLSVLDRSPAGAQPMRSACGRYVVTFNGEIYDFTELREQLVARGHAFRGGSDTEVLLAAVVEWGLDGALERCNGMFALALWDTRDHELHLARDRFGEKPLYYGWAGPTLVFGSELKAVRAHPGFSRTVDRAALARYLPTGRIPAPSTIYRDARTLPPGHVLTVRRGEARPEPRPYWSPREVAERAAEDRFPGSFTDAVEELDRLVLDAVRIRMRADVPVGAFLSGGIDSSTIVAAMQRTQTAPVHTFTIGFDDAAFDESAHARAVARHLGTDHTDLRVTATDALEVVRRLPDVYDEPFGDSSEIPTVLVSMLAREQVTVALSGDGGDELFGGYPSAVRTDRLWRRIARVPAPLRRSTAAVLRRLPDGPGRSNRWAARRRFWGEVLPAADPESLHATLGARGRGARAVVLSTPEPTLPHESPYGGARLPSAAERIAFHQTVEYLPNDLLVKMDRAGMSVGLEVRAPLLDPRVFELAARLPLDMKLRDGEAKQVLRGVLHRSVPASLVDRPKQGFGVPLTSWLQTDLREWAAPLVDERRLRDEGFLDPRPIRERWDAVQAGTPYRHALLWNVLMFQAWLEGERS